MSLKTPMRAARTRTVAVVTGAFLFGLISACTMEPRYKQPVLPVPDQWPIPATTAGTTPAAPAPAAAEAQAMAVRDIGWHDFFADTRLQNLIAAALVNNRDLRVAILNIEKARAQYRIQRSVLFPSINASGNFTREKLPPALTFGTESFTSNIYQAGVGISNYEVDLFGRVRSLTHSALEQYLAQEEARRSAQLSLIAEVANAYLTLASDKDLQHLALQTLESQEHSFELARRSHDAGATSGLDLAQAQTTVEQARADAARYEGNVAQDIDALTLLVGEPLEPTWVPEEFDAKTMGLEALPAGLPSDVLLRRPDVLEAEHLLRSANGNIGAARAAFFPTISLTTSIGSASEDLSHLFKSGSGTWTFSPTISLPLFHGGEIVGNLSLANTNQKIAVAQYEKAVQTSFREVADALALTATLNRQRAAQEALVAATGRAYELSQQRYKAGRDSFLDVLVSQRSDYSAQQGLIATRLAEQTNRVNLYTELGGGWREQTQKSANP
ncbi:MAG TPA: efflux transporter outer membrane subunit [Steroidobacteraceae bacterium]|jgi:multidrug efflux system outer membrane protein|nr:efflux transporter outer membrane subunit [Steroidobacteraceae bacterium]